VELRRGIPARFSLAPLCVALAAALAVAGCSAPGGSPGSVTQPTLPGGDLLDTNGSVTIGVRSLPTNFNPSTPAGDNRITQMVMEQVWPQPFVTDPSFTVETSGLLESAEVQSVSPLTVVYVINADAVWSDGVPIGAADFIYAWHEHLSESAALPDSGLVAGYRDIASVVGSDGGRTVTVTFSRPFSQWQSLFANLVPAHIAARYGWSAGFARFSRARLISGGPFEVTSYSPGRELVLSRNPRYWGTPAHVAHIRFVVERSERALVAGLQSGALSVAEVNASQPQLDALGNAALGSTSGDSVRTDGQPERSSHPGLAWSGATSSEIWQLCFNFEDPLTSEIAVRRGIEHGLDRSEIVADSEDLVHPRIRVAISRLTLAGESTSPSSSGTSPVIQQAPVLYEPAVARHFFRSAGYMPGEGGYLRLDGIGGPLTVSLLEPSNDWPVDQAGQVIQAQLRSIGLTVRIQKRPLRKMLSRLLPRGSYQLALAPFEVSPTEATVAPEYSDPVLPPRTPSSGALRSGHQRWTTKVELGTDPGAVAAGAVTRDISGVEDHGINRRFAQALGELNPPAATTYLQKAEAVMWNQVVTIPLFQPGFDLVRSVRIDNVSESPTWAGLMWDAEDWAILKHPPKTTPSTAPGAG
jgi:peptide/nickel transport system substrate-binding protein